jgi:hypothetical protein
MAGGRWTGTVGTVTFGAGTVCCLTALVRTAGLAAVRAFTVLALAVLALVRGRLVAFLAVPPVRVLLRARFAEPLRAAVRVVVCAGIDLPP